MDGNGTQYLDVEAYLKYLGFEKDHSVGPVDYWERADGKHIILHSNGQYLKLPMLNDILTDLGKQQSDFDVFIVATRSPELKAREIPIEREVEAKIEKTEG